MQTTITPARPGEIKYKDKRLLVLYFDFQGMAPDDQIRVQNNALKFLNTQMTASDLVALMSYAGELKVLAGLHRRPRRGDQASSTSW